MKIHLSILIIIAIFTLAACNSNSDLGFFPKEGLSGLRKFLNSIEPEEMQKFKNSLIDKLKKKAKSIKPILEKHNDQNWTEDSTQFGMKDNNSNNDKAFDIIYNDKNKISDDTNQNIRKLFYLSLDYNETQIKNFAEVLNQIALKKNNNTKNIPLIRNIINAAIQYSHNYFLVAFTQLINKKDKLEFLSIQSLRLLKEKFDHLEIIRNTWQQAIKSIINDYINNTKNIKNDHTQIIAYINSKNNFQTALQYINQINRIINNIANLLTN